MWAIYWRTIRDRRSSLAIYVAITVILVWLYVSLFPEMAKQSERFNELMKAYPEQLMKAFGIESPGVIFSKLENFLAMEQYSLTWPILLVALFISWGGAALAGEIEKGTIELLLAQPVSRSKLFWSKYLSGLSGLIVFVLVSVYSAIPLAAAYDVSYRLAHFNKMAIIGFLFGWAIFSLAIFFSALFSERGRVYFLTAGVTLIMYVLNLVANLKESLSDLKYLSLFHYFNANDALMENKIDDLSYLVFIVSALVFSGLGALTFTRRDIAV
ncbi:MAG: ABC transporter permease subunit [Patescibacteria group bacterium]|mgnify:CR=1 FL=1